MHMHTLWAVAIGLCGHPCGHLMFPQQRGDPTRDTAITTATSLGEKITTLHMDVQRKKITRNRAAQLIV